VALRVCKVKSDTLQYWRFWADYARREPARAAADLLAARARAGPHVSRIYTLDDGAAAIRALVDRDATGKLVIAVRAA